MSEHDHEAESLDREAFTKVAEVGEIPAGRGIGVDVDGIEIAVFNVGDGEGEGDDEDDGDGEGEGTGEYYAISNRCAHQQAPLCKAGEAKINAEHTWTQTRGGVNPEACTVSCPWHLWTWDLETGENEASGKRIGTFECVVADGDVLVRI